MASVALVFGMVMFAIPLVRQRKRAAAIAATLMICMAGMLRAQQPSADTTKCDSIVFASRVDSVRVALFVSTGRADGYVMSPEQSHSISTAVATIFVPP